MEDITYRYNATPGYPEHTLLIEATLAEANAQRRMEMEPVSRHLGDFLLRDNRQEAYALFVTTFLHLTTNYTRYSSALTKTMSLPKHGMKTTLCALYNRRNPPQGY